MITRILRASERAQSSHDGVESWHCFSSGAHYAADNVAHGAIVGCDEHVLAPGAGFDWHPHRGVDIVSWVVSGQLLHEDDTGSAETVVADHALVQLTGSGIRHRETNPGSTPLRLVQMTVLGAGSEPSTNGAEPPLEVTHGRLEVWRADGAAQTAQWHVFVVDGLWRLEDSALAQGDSARGADRLAMAGAGVALVWLLSQV